jgi:hypothetical protein
MRAMVFALLILVAPLVCALPAAGQQSWSGGAALPSCKKYLATVNYNGPADSWSLLLRPGGAPSEAFEAGLCVGRTFAAAAIATQSTRTGLKDAGEMEVWAKQERERCQAAAAQGVFWKDGCD